MRRLIGLVLVCAFLLVAGRSTLATRDYLDTGILVRSSSLTYNTVGTLSASLLRNGQSLAGKSLEFLVEGVSVGIGSTNAAGLATVVVSTVILNAGVYPDGLEVRFAGDGDLGPQTALADLSVSPYLPTITWPEPASVLVGTTLSAAQLNASVDAPGTLVYSPPEGTVLTTRYYYGYPGLTVTFVPDDPQNYVSVTTDRYIRVNVPNILSERSAPVEIARITGGARVGTVYPEPPRAVNPAVDSLRDLVYLPNALDGTVVVADGKTGQTIRVIALNFGGVVGTAGSMALDQARNRLYVADALEPKVWIINPVADTPVIQVQMLPVPDTAKWVEFNPSTGLLYVLAEVFLVLDPANPSSIVSIPTCSPESLAINTVTNLIYIASAWCETLEIVDGDPQRMGTFNTVVAALPAPATGSQGNGSGIAVNTRTHRVYMLASYGGPIAVHVFDGDPLSPGFHQEPYSMVLPGLGTPGDGYVWATGIGMDASRGLLYLRAADWQGNANVSSHLTVIDVRTDAVASVTMLPEEQVMSWGHVGVNANTGRIYVTSSNNVTNVFQEVREATLETPPSAAPVTVASSQVSLTFAAVATSGQTTIEQIDPATVNATLPGGFQIEGGQAFEISTTAVVSSPIQVCFDASWVTDVATFDTLAVLHGENGAWVDRTVSRNFATTTICASVTSLSPFVIARYIEPAYGVVRLYDSTKSFKAGSTAPIRLQITDAGGVNLSSASLVVHAVDLWLTSTSASSSVVDSGQSNSDDDFRFDPGLGGSGGYIFNLKTTGLSTGSYELRFTIGNGRRQYAVPVQIR